MRSGGRVPRGRAGRAADAVRLYAAAQRIAPSPSGTDEPVEGDLAGGLETARAALGAEAFAREWTLGTTLPRRPGPGPVCTTSWTTTPTVGRPISHSPAPVRMT